MSLFVSSSCQIIGETIVNRMEWSKSDHLAALSIFSVDDNEKEINQVVFSNNEGEILSNSLISHDYEATAFDWHPSEKLIAIGWDDGMISCWHVDGKNRASSTFTNNIQHRYSISVLKWNPTGKRLVTGDKKGVICIWSADSRGSLNPMRQYKKKGEITSIVYCLIQPKIPDIPSFRNRHDKGIKASNYSPSFFFGTDRGAIVYADDMGHCTDVQQLSSSIDSMMFFEEKSRLVIITRSLLLTQYHVSEDGRVSRVMQVKLSIPGEVMEKGIQSIVWAGPGLIAAATEEKFLRLIDIAADESYNLSLSSVLGNILDRSDRVTCVAFSPVDRYLAIGTIVGVVVVWKFTGKARDLSGFKSNVPSTSVMDWEFVYKAPLNSSILQLAWYEGKGTLGVVTEDGAIILNESVMNGAMRGDIAVLQINNNEIALHIGGSPDSIVINTGLQIRGLSVGNSCFVVWSGKVAKVYRVDVHLHKADPMEPIISTSLAMAIADASHIVDEAWFVVDGSIVKINNFTGTQKGSIGFSEAEGQPQHIDINGKYLAIVSNKGMIKVMDVNTPTKPKQLGGVGTFYNNKSSLTGGQNIDEEKLKIRQIKVNASGTMIAILADQVEGSLKICNPDFKLYIYDRIKGSILEYDFSAIQRTPMSIFWDEEDERLLSCEAFKQRSSDSVNSVGIDRNKSIHNNSILANNNEEDEEGREFHQNNNSKSKSDSEIEAENEIEVYLFFATSENGILMQDSFPRKHPFGPMVGLSVPRLYFKNAPPPKATEGDEDDEVQVVNYRNTKIYSKVMRDFIGMEEVNEVTKSALLDFSYFLTLGKLDEAYRVVKAINNPSIWENMAQMCVKTKRLDVAEVCLGNMGHARGAAAVREAKKSGNIEATIGVLAIQLGLLDDAASLFRESNRFDLLNNLYQAAGLWDKAIATAQKRDRIHLKNTHYQYAKHLESIGNIDEAIEHFDLSENSKTEIPRLLFNLGRVDQLSEYIQKSNDPELLKWWAAYMESLQKFDRALKFYKKAKDYFSIVRIFCFKGEYEKAAEIIADSGDRASAYHFARHLEGQGEYQEAINFYSLSGCFNHSIRLAKAYNLDSELMRFAIKSTPALMIESAVHFQNKGEYDKAIQLYHKGGDIPRALELAFKIGENPKNPHAKFAFDMLNTIAQDLGVDSSPQTLARCADFLVQHKQFEKAIELYVMASRYHSAVEMCIQNKVSINDDMVEKLTPPSSMDPSERKEILLDVAKALKKQGSYTLASKKYTQAGDRIRAIKCLVRSGDTKAVIQFASISRNAEIYRLAANYLQQMNWRESVDIMKAIITFYSKAKAFIQLAGFYDSCAQVEIDEYRDYEKAIGALKEALKYLAKDNSQDAEDMILNIEKRILMIEKFVQAKKVAKKDPTTMVAICEALLQEPSLEEAIRSGDCFAMLVEYFHSSGQVQEAYHYLQEMEERRIPLHPYIDGEIIEEIFKAAGVSKRFQSNQSSSMHNKHEADDDGDDIDEEIDEEIEEEDARQASPGKLRYGAKPKNPYFNAKK